MVPRASCSLDTTTASCQSICGGPPSAIKGAEQRLAEQRLAEQRLTDVGGAWKPRHETASKSMAAASPKLQGCGRVKKGPTFRIAAIFLS